MTTPTTANKRIAYEVEGILRRLNHVAFELRGMDVVPNTVDQDAALLSEAVEIAVAKKLLAIWESRSLFLDLRLIEDPGWMMLLNLKIAEMTHQRTSVSMLCGDSRVPQTTALRWINSMEQKGLLRRQSDLMDRRRALISLSTEASALMSRYLAHVARYFGTSAP
jgi:DNA-binding MarR family transcriptional regulator